MMRNFLVTKYGKNQILLKPWERLEKVMILKTGQIRTYIDYGHGREIDVPDFQLLTDISLALILSGQTNRFGVKTLTPVEVYEVSIDELKKDPKSYEEMVNKSMKTFLRLIEYNSDLLAGTAYNKVALTIDYLTKQYGEISLHKNGWGVSHKLIASLTGLTRETVTLQMIKMEKEGIIINKSKSVEVVDKIKLKKAIEVA